MSDDRQKVDAYLEMIQDHVLSPIQGTDLKESCTATVLLIFGSIDGLGKLTHPEDLAGAGKRFKWYLRTFMRPEYGTHCDALYTLRCSLAHNALNFTSFISKTRMGEQHHLEFDSTLGYVFVSSAVLTRDFDASLRKLDEELNKDTKLITRAASRLHWLEDNTYAYWSQFSTPPGPIPFINLK
ncbi:MAG: hypothetical protein WC637_16960 [Victivallales bacterium]